MLYPANTKIDFYLDPGFSADSDMELRLLTKMPQDDFIWYSNFLITIGDLLITTGAGLKDAATHPVNIFSGDL